jgi:hypothetical protein
LTSAEKTCGTSEPLNINSLKNYTKISSPGFPNGYGPNQNCEWVFTTIQMNSLKMYIAEMDLTPGYGSRCYGDYVEIFEKKINADWTSLLKTCYADATRSPPIVTANMMKVVFKSDGHGNRTGFEAIVREGGSMEFAKLFFFIKLFRLWRHFDRSNWLYCLQ